MRLPVQVSLLGIAVAPLLKGCSQPVVFIHLLLLHHLSQKMHAVGKESARLVQARPHVSTAGSQKCGCTWTIAYAMVVQDSGCVL